MDKLKELETILNTMKIKQTRFNGCDKEDVERKFQLVFEWVKDTLLLYEKKEAKLTDRYNTRIHALEMAIRSLNQKLSLAEQEKEDAIKKIKEACIDQYDGMIKECMESLEVLTKDYTLLLSYAKELEESESPDGGRKEKIAGIANKYQAHKEKLQKEKEQDVS